MKNKILVRKTRVPVYRSRLWIVICPNIMKAIDSIEDQISSKIHADKDKLSTKAYAYAETNDKGLKTFLLFLSPGATHGTIAHEVKHMVNMIFSWHGVRLSLTNDEPECYHLERITNQVYSAILSYKKLYSKPSKPKRIETLIQHSSISFNEPQNNPSQ